jgi:hypothetical protein
MWTLTYTCIHRLRCSANFVVRGILLLGKVYTLLLLRAPLASLWATPTPGHAGSWFFIDSKTPIHSVQVPTERMLWHKRLGRPM